MQQHRLRYSPTLAGMTMGDQIQMQDEKNEPSEHFYGSEQEKRTQRKNGRTFLLALVTSNIVKQSLLVQYFT